MLRGVNFQPLRCASTAGLPDAHTSLFCRCVCDCAGALQGLPHCQAHLPLDDQAGGTRLRNWDWGTRDAWVFILCFDTAAAGAHERQRACLAGCAYAAAGTRQLSRQQHTSLSHPKWQAAAGNFKTCVHGRSMWPWNCRQTCAPCSVCLQCGCSSRARYCCQQPNGPCSALLAAACVHITLMTV